MSIIHSTNPDEGDDARMIGSMIELNRSRFARVICKDGVFADIVDIDGISLVKRGILVDKIEVTIEAGQPARAILHVPIIEVDVTITDAKMEEHKV